MRGFAAFNAFYEQELRTLKDAKAEFDNSYKNAEFSFYTEQVLAGLASLTARIRQEMEESENEIARDFVESVAPEMLLPLPARSLVEIIPSPSDNQEREIPCGAMLSSKLKNEKAFFWRVKGSHLFKPGQKIISVRAVEDSEGFDCLEIESKGSGPWIIFIDGEAEFAWALWFFMLEHAKPFVIAKPENPWELCRDFFCFEEKFRFIYMENLPQKIRFAKKIPKSIFSKIQTQNFKLGVLPIENSFEQNLEPVLMEEGVFETKISACETRQSILHLKQVRAGNAEVKYRYNQGKLYVAVPQKANTLSICAVVCDGVSAESSLEEGSVLQAKNSAMQMCEIRSITKALPFLPPLRNNEPEWEAVCLLQRNYMQFFEGDSLKNALEMQLWNVQGPRNYLVHGIKKVFCEIKNGVHNSCIVPKACVKIVLLLDFFDKNNYEFFGILHAYGEMLFYLFRKIFICNMLIELVLRIEHAGMELKWE